MNTLPPHCTFLPSLFCPKFSTIHSFNYYPSSKFRRMESTNVTESLTEWEIVVVKSNDHSHNDNNHLQSDHSDSPPTSPDSLHVPPPPPPPELPSSPEFQSQNQPSSDASTNNADGGETLRSGSRVQKAGNKIAKLLRPAIICLGSRVRYYMPFRISWSPSPTLVTVALGFVLLFSRLQRWRQWLKEENNRLILIIKEKDQMINELLDQIVLLKERLSVRLKVPVIRVR